jgi:4-amino-4-deoxychorismate lyase
VSEKYLETIKAVDGKIYNLEFHQWRLDGVLKSLGVTKRYQLVEHISAPQDGFFRCRIVYDAKNIEVEYIPYVKRDVKRLKLIYNDEIEYEKKYANRELLDSLFALKAECDDILIVKSGLITDTSIANIAFFDGEQWLTPKRPLLRGTTRERYLKSKKIVEKDIFVDDLQEFSKIALMNAMVDFDIIPSPNREEIIC